ncbi:MAG: hypothetical protein AAGA48_33805 [Myxococcota bacterium]
MGLLTACLGTPSPEASNSATADDGTPKLSCPEGTAQQSGTSPEGEEYWCDRSGVMHGPFLKFHPNGMRAASGTWEENQRSGQWTWWFNNEQTKMKGKYDRGKQTGSWTWWHDNGNRQQEGDFLLGRRQGKWTTFYPSGNRESEGMYHNDNRSDSWKYYDDDDTDKVVRTESYENGKVVEKPKR